VSDSTPAPGGQTALDDCAREPIHRLGLVQPHGAVLIARLDTGRISHCSSNVVTVLGTPVMALLGKPLELWLNVSLQELTARAKDANVTGRRFHTVAPWREGEAALHAMAHCHDGLLVLELQPLAHGELAAPLDPWHLAEDLQTRLDGAVSVEAMALSAAQAMGELTRFARVMVYRFDPEWRGEVIAEVTRPGIPERFNGHWFPSSDIPPQARELYVKNRVRLIANSGATPVPLLADPADPALAGNPPDLSYALLRSVSPAHIEYLRNMGVLASMSASLVVEGRLWGLLVCHDDLPRPVPPALMRHLDGLCQLFSTAIARRLLELDRARESMHLHARAHLLRTIHATVLAAPSLEEGLTAVLGDLLVACEADSCLLQLDGALHHAGAELPEPFQSALLDLLQAVPASQHAFACNRSDALPGAAATAGDWAGMLATRLPGAVNGWIALLRKQRVVARRWGGDPTKPKDAAPASGRLSPRRSFATWVEEVRGEAPPWLPAQVESLSRAAEATSLAVMQRAGRQSLQSLEVLHAGLARISDIVLITEATPTRHPGPRIVYVNDAFERLTGYTRDEVIGRNPRMLQGPLTQRGELDRINVALRRAEPVQAELINYHKDGTPYWLAIEIVPVFDSAGVATHFVAIESDISERKRQEGVIRDENRALAEVNARLDRILRTAQEGVVLLGGDGRLEYANPRFLDWLGRGVAAPTGQPLASLLAPDAEAALAERLRGPAIRLAERFDIPLATASGARRWLRMTGTPIDGDASPQGWLLMFSDVGALREAERQLGESQELLEQVGRLARVGGWRLELGSGDLLWTAETRRIHEVDDDFVPTLENAVAFYVGADRDRISAVVEAAIRDNTTWDIEARILTARGNERWVRTIGVLEQEDGVAKRLLGAFADISEQHRLRTELESSNARFAATVRGSGAGHWDCNLQRGEVHYSDRFLELLGVAERAQFPPRIGSVLRRLGREDRQRLREAILRHLAGEAPSIEMDLPIHCEDGTLRWFSLRGQCSHDQSSPPQRIAGSLVDIDERKRMEAALMRLNVDLEARIEARTRDLQEALQRADEASQSKSIFLANMSHELRSPLHAILGFAKLAIEDQALLSAAQHAGFLRRITKSASHLLALVNDLLDSAKFESRTFTIAHRRCDLAEVVRDVGTEFERNHEGVERLRISAPPNAPVHGDPERLGQVLRNLLANADRFTPAGGVIDVVLQGSSPGGWRLQVIDDGPGLVEAERERIFERFVQSNSPRHAKGGTGLGLSIARAIAELHGGTLAADNMAGRGACFTLVLPGEGEQRDRGATP